MTTHTFNSQHWYSNIERLADEYWNIADRQFVTFSLRSINSASKAYQSRLAKLKKDIFGKNSPIDKKIDRHKAIALHIQIFLEKPIFKMALVTEAEHGSWPETKLFNEMFCFDLMRAILEDWCGIIIDKSKVGEYYFTILKLFYHYREYCIRYKIEEHGNKSEFDKRNNLFTYMLAHLIYFIELNFANPT